MAISGVKNVAMKAGRGLAKARNEGATYKAGGKIAAPKGKADLPPWMMKKGMKKGGKC
jgi:hypothetical protein